MYSNEKGEVLVRFWDLKVYFRFLVTEMINVLNDIRSWRLSKRELLRINFLNTEITKYRKEILKNVACL